MFILKKKKKKSFMAGVYNWDKPKTFLHKRKIFSQHLVLNPSAINTF